MDRNQTFDVSQLVDEAKVGRFTLRLLVFSVLIIFIDGFDIQNIGFAVPPLARAWNIADPSRFGPVLAASLIGLLFGGPLFGYVGDRFGRKKAIVLSGLLFGVFTWAAVLTSSLSELFWVRVLGGVAMGGLLPNVIALNVEFAPKRLRATLTVLMFSGIGLGAALPGPVAAWLVPIYGWQALFSIGGVLAILISLACLWGLPESIKYLTLKQRSAEAASLLARLRPDLSFGAGASFAMRDEKHYTGSSPKHLFGDGLAPLTVLLWIICVTALMGYFFLIAWTPYLLTNVNIPVARAALATSIFQFGGLVGGWAICHPIDVKGMKPVAWMFTVAIPVVGAIGYVGAMSEPLLLAFLFVAGFCVLGGQYAINAISGMIYPTAFRANGSGWAFGVGKVGAIGGPLVGGVLIGMHLPAQQLYLLAALPFVICAPACFLFARLYDPRFLADRRGSPKGGETEPAPFTPR